MNTWQKVLTVIVLAITVVMIVAPVAAQNQAERERAESAREIDSRMREAEQQLEAAAQRIAELSGEQLARAGQFERRFVIANGRPVLGITIGSDREKKPVEGVTIIGVSPGGAADEADLRSGDIITAINGELFSSSSGAEANSLLLDFMQGVEAGDVLTLEYLRDSKTGTVEIAPRQMNSHAFNFKLGGADFHMPALLGVPNAQVLWINRHGGHGFGEMEMVELNKTLGRYFGTDTGLLVVKAPKDNAYQLQDGDVIMNIDGRTPKDLGHAVRILSSYQSGEIVKIEIMRDKRQKTIKVEVPDNRRSHEFRLPSVVPAPAVVVAPNVRVVRKIEERT